VARAVAEAPVPTICGIGHQTDKSIADIVAHTSCRTPTETAELLVRQVGDSAARIDRTARELALQAQSLVRSAESRTAAIPHRIVARSRSLLDGQALRCDALRRDLTRSASRSLGAAGRLLRETRRALGRRAEASVVRSGERVRAVASRFPGPGRRFLAQARGQEQEQRRRLLRNALQPLERAGRQIEAHRRLIDQLAPARTRARGFSLTRRADGRLLRSVSDVRHGTSLETRVADGTVFSHAFGVSRGTDPGPPVRLGRRRRVSRRKAVADGEPRQQSFLVQEEQT